MNPKQNSKLTTFTTRVDTIYAVSFVCVSPEHPNLSAWTTAAQKPLVDSYIEEVKNKSERDRQIGKDKTGVFVGSYAKNPVTGELVPIWVSDYVLPGYGTGAVMGVAGHDERDYEFAQKFGLEIKYNIKNPEQNMSDIDSTKAMVANGILFNSEECDGLNCEQAKAKLSNQLSENNQGRVTTNYKFRDWVFSRQRYWGEPFPFEYIEV